jgi:hypothetical protein
MREVDRVRGPVSFKAEFPGALSSGMAKAKKNEPVEFSLDVYSKRPWASPKEQPEGVGTEATSLGVGAETPTCVLPSRALQPHGDRPRLVSYYCCVVAEGLPRQESAYVRVIVGNGDAGPRERHGQQADADADADRHCHYDSDRIPTDWKKEQLEWHDIQVILPLSDCRVRVQIWSEAGQSLVGPLLRHQEDRLLCQAVIRPDLINVDGKREEGRPPDNWYHCYGGARDANRDEEARQMAFGIIHPASTYCCSVGMRLSFWPSSAHSQDAQPWSYLSLDRPGWQKEPEKFTLTVRLHRCLYLSSLAGSCVTVFVELAGNHFGDQATQPLLAFPGTVSPEGVLLFHAPTDASATGFGPPLWSSQSEPAVVERCTVGLTVRPGVTHAYVYVVQAGHEALPPRIFGRLRLGRPCATPKWQRLRFDASVAELPSLRFDRKFAGCILGSAVLQPGAVDLKKGGWLAEASSGAPLTGIFGFGQPAPMKFSLGAREVKRSQGVGEQIFYHVDVLAARSLPPSSDDGLCSAGYRIHVEGETLTHDHNIQESLNPTFWNRAVIPVDADGYGTPAPPLVIKVFDEQASVELGSLFIKESRRIYASSVEELNSHHRAFWYALDSTAMEAFDPRAATDVLRCSPRLLLAIAHSSAERQNSCTHEPAFSPIPVLDRACYCVNIDLLGFRGLPESVDLPELVVSSFAEKADGVRVPVARGQHRRNPNFESERAESRGVGVSLQGHICHVPVIPYLQPPCPEGLRAAADGLCASASLPDLPADGEPAVLLPDLVLQLMDGSKKLGALSLPLGTPDSGHMLARSSLDGDGKTPGLRQSSKSRLSRDGGQAPDGAADAMQDGIHSSEIDTDSYSVFVDFFAAESGHMRWNPRIAVGRRIIEQRLFEISQDDAAEPDPKYAPQYFNVSDCLLNMGSSLSEPFDQRVSPVFRCAKWDPLQSDWIPTREDDAVEWPANLLTGFSVPQRGRIAASLPESTRWMSNELSKNGWRYVSHLTAPEKLSFSASPYGGNLDANLQTFMRPVNHIIRGGKSDSRFLGRLWMTQANHLRHYKVRPELSRKPTFLGVSIATNSTSSTNSSLVRSSSTLANAGKRYLKGQSEEKKGVEGLAYYVRKPRASDDEFELDPNGDVAPWGTTVAGEDEGDGWLKMGHKYLRMAGLEEHVVPPAPHFLLIEFNKRGKVVWTPPEDVCQWQEAGSTLFVVQLEEDRDTFVKVVLPSFDVRFPMETAWYVRKTLTTRWRNVYQEAAANQDAHAPASSSGRRKARSRTRFCASLPSQEENNDFRNGYTQDIAVAKNAFICRVRCRNALRLLDRPQSRNWFREMASESCPQVRVLPMKAPGPDRLAASQAVMRQCSNLRHGLIHGVSEEEVCVVKGHVQIRKLPACSAESACKQNIVRLGKGQGRDSRDTQYLREWHTTELAVDVHVLTASGLPEEVGGSQLYLVAAIPGSGWSAQMDVRLSSEPVECLAQAGPAQNLRFAQFYHVFKIRKIHLPGPSKLKLQVWQKGPVPALDSQLAFAEFDLEDRWLTLQHQAHEQGANAVVPPRQQPLEFRELLQPGVREEDAVGQVGDIRLWIDIYQPNLYRKHHLMQHSGNALQVLKTVTVELQIRVIIKEVTGITVFKDWAQRNDVKVVGVLRTRNCLWQEQLEVSETDVHRWARDYASFNWRWILNVRAPLTMCLIDFTLIDVDLIGEEVIYEQEELALDHDMLEVCRSGQARKKNVRLCFSTPGDGKLTHCSDVFPCLEWFRFDCLLLLHLRNCCKRRPLVKEPAVLHLELEILPRSQADADPKLAGCVAQPHGRMAWAMLVEDPLGFIKTALGPRVYKGCIRSSFCAFSCFLVFAFLVMVFLLQQTFLFIPHA